MVFHIKIASMLGSLYLKSQLLSKSSNKCIYYGIHFNMRNIHSSAITNSFWELHKKEAYYKESKVPKTQLIKAGLKEIKSEVYKWQEEVKEAFEGDPILVYRPGEIDRCFNFVNEDSIKNWLVTSDSDHNEGHSHCKLECTEKGTALFSGELRTEVPKVGKIKKSGYCNITSYKKQKSFKRDTYYDWTPYTHLEIKCRGDGRSYLLVLSTEGYFDVTWNDSFQFVLYTRGGPYWQTSKIPLSKFFLCSKGRVQDKQFPIPLHRIARFGITAADKIEGPFQLELAHIGLEYDPRHTETTAYEMYTVPKFIVGV